MSKVLVVVKETRLSGSVKIALESSSQFCQKVDVLTMGCESENNDKTLIKNYSYINKIFFGCGIIGLTKFIIRNSSKYEVIYSHSSINGFIVRILKLFFKFKVIHVVHGVAWHSKSNILIRVTTFIIDYILALFLTDRLILVNSHYYKFFYGCKNRMVIWNYADIKETNTNDKISKNIVFIGRLDYQKRPLLFLEVIKDNLSLIQSHNWKVSIFGDGELINQCKKYTLENNMTSVVTFFGWTDWRNEYVFKDCIHCVTSAWEAFGLNIVEAGLLKIPTVAFDVEGLSQVINEGETGLLVKTKLYFCRALKELIINENYRIYLGETAKITYKNKFSKQKFNNEYNNVFKSYFLEKRISND
jgi:glycosyltransferase involved in cell wall biosynthesis